MLHSGTPKSAQNLPLVSQLLYIVTGTRSNCGLIFCRCFASLICRYDVHADNGGDCDFNNFIKLKDLYWAKIVFNHFTMMK